MKKYLEEGLTKSEEMLLEQFDSTLFTENLEEVTQRLSRNNIKHIQGGQRPSNSKSYSRQNWLAVAATIIVLITIGTVSYYSMQQKPQAIEVAQVVKTTPFGKRLTLHLSDGTKVHLNAGSTIEFPERFTGAERVIKMEGEAFFDVSKDSTRPFIIHSGNVKTTVLGTSFNINSFGENSAIKVSVKSGKVTVNSPGDGVVIGAYQQAVFDKKTKKISKETIKSDDQFAWKDGVLQFKDLQIVEVLKRLERYYGVDFSLGNQSIGNCHLTATFKNESLTSVMESILYTKKGLRYQYVNDREIRITGKCTD